MRDSHLFQSIIIVTVPRPSLVSWWTHGDIAIFKHSYVPLSPTGASQAMRQHSGTARDIRVTAPPKPGGAWADFGELSRVVLRET